MKNNTADRFRQLANEYKFNRFAYLKAKATQLVDESILASEKVAMHGNHSHTVNGKILKLERSDRHRLCEFIECKLRLLGFNKFSVQVFSYGIVQINLSW